MSFPQRIFTFLLPRRWMAAMEAESREWKVTHEACGWRSSVWDLGGIRWGASGSNAVRMECRGCGVRGWMKVHRERAASKPAD